MVTPIGLHDLDFDQVPVNFASTKGRRFARWLRVGMPRIPEQVLDCVFFLYRTKEDARAGINPGGTGFVVEVGSNLYVGAGHFAYGVTNWHVACDLGFSVIRLTTEDGGVEIVDLGPEDWEFMPSGPDLAITQLSFSESHVLQKIPSISIGQFAPRESWNNADQYPCVGDDVFMLGLFVDHDGLTTNRPSARFGNISMMPSEEALIRQPTGYDGESYVIDMHSRTGFSGSPVFVYRTFGSDLTTAHHYLEEVERGDDARGVRATFRTMFYFLGAHWGQFPESWELRKKNDISENRKPHLITDGAYVEGMSGMTCVIPSWDIEEVLKLPKLKKAREEQLASQKRPVGPRPESTTFAETDGANQEHREDFNRLLSEAARKREPKDQT